MRLNRKGNSQYNPDLDDLHTVGLSMHPWRHTTAYRLYFSFMITTLSEFLFHDLYLLIVLHQVCQIVVTLINVIIILLVLRYVYYISSTSRAATLLHRR